MASLFNTVVVRKDLNMTAGLLSAQKRTKTDTEYYGKLKRPKLCR